VNTEDRLRAATRARADLVRDIRPLELPEQAPGRARRVARAWGGWLVPVAAAAVVVALALTLVAVRHAAAPPAAPALASPPAGPAPASVLAKIPRYYAAITQDGSIRYFTVTDVRTGKHVVGLTAPGDGFLDGVSASSDDKTFISTFSTKVNQDTTRWTVQKIRLFPHPGLALSIAVIAVQDTDNAAHLDAYLSPNGREVAVQFERVTGTTVTTTIQMYHATESSPAPLRTWTATMRGAAPIGDLSWRDGQSLEFSTPASAVTGAQPPAYSHERALNTTAPSGDLMTASRVIFSGPPPSDPASCAALRITPDGQTAICGTQVTAGSGSPGCAAGLGLLAYSVRTGQRERVLAGYPQPCSAGIGIPVWADTTASTVVGLFWQTSGRSTRTVLGVAAGGKLYSLPLPLPGILAGGTGDATTIAF
jgi:hypothetical protein